MKSLNSQDHNRYFVTDKRKLRRLIHELKIKLKKRLTCIIGYGSFFNDKQEFVEDLDLVMVLKYQKPDDLLMIRNAFKLSKIKYKAQFQILYVNQLLNDGLFYSINRSGSFFLKVLLNKSIVLYGHNILKQLTPAGQLSDQIALIQKWQQYVYEITNTYLNQEQNRTEIVRFIRKKLNIIKYDFTIFSSNIKIEKNLNKKIKSLYIIIERRDSSIDYIIKTSENIFREVLSSLLDYIHKYYEIDFLKIKSTLR